MNPNGSGLKPLLGTVPAGASDFAWSPNGHRIVFDAADRIYVVNADGSNLKLLVSGSRGSGPGAPSWSPDGTRILFFSTPGHSNAFKAEVWLMSPAGTQRRRLYHSICCLYDWGAPIWSPDGKRILFSVHVDHRGPSGTFLMDADGRNLHRLPDFAYSTADLAWQPVP